MRIFEEKKTSLELLNKTTDKKKIAIKEMSKTNKKTIELNQIIYFLFVFL